MTMQASQLMKKKIRKMVFLPLLGAIGFVEVVKILLKPEEDFSIHSFFILTPTSMKKINNLPFFEMAQP
jgi:hypothetical protein